MKKSKAQKATRDLILFTCDPRKGNAGERDHISGGLGDVEGADC